MRGPFAQQVVSYPLILHPTGNATIPQAFNWTGVTDTSDVASQVISGSIANGLVLGNFSLSDVTPICSTGNCTWPHYSSLAICASVEDVSPLITKNDCNITAFNEVFEIAELTNPGYPCFNYTLPYIVRVPTIDGHANQLSNATLSNAIPSIQYGTLGMMEILSIGSAYTNISSLTTAYLIYQPNLLPNASLSSPIAYKLNIDFCVQTYESKMSNGVVNTSTISNQILSLNTTEFWHPNNDTIGIFRKR